MVKARDYSTVSVLRDGRHIEIRALQPGDRTALLDAIGRASPLSLYRRFFAIRRYFSEKEIAFMTEIDFVTHVALVAIAEENGNHVIIGGGRYVVSKPGKAELAFAVIDQYQGQGIGTALASHLIAIAREAGLKELVADVLPENTSMLKVFEKSGLPISTERDPDVTHVAVQL